MGNLTSGDLNKLKVMAAELESHLSGLVLTREGRSLIYAPFGTEQKAPLALSGSRARRTLTPGMDRTKTVPFDHLVAQGMSLTVKLDNLNGSVMELTRKAEERPSPDEPNPIFPEGFNEQATSHDVKNIRNTIEHVTSIVTQTMKRSLGAIQKEGEAYPSFKFERVRSAEGHFSLKTTRITSVKPPESAAKRISRDWLATVDGLKMELGRMSEKVSSLMRNLDVLALTVEERSKGEEEMVR